MVLFVFFEIKPSQNIAFWGRGDKKQAHFLTCLAFFRIQTYIYIVE